MFYSYFDKLLPSQWSVCTAAVPRSPVCGGTALRIRMLPVFWLCWQRLQPVVLTWKKTKRNTRHKLLAYRQQPTMIHYFGKQIGDSNVLFRSFVQFSNIQRSRLTGLHSAFCKYIPSSVNYSLNLSI